MIGGDENAGSGWFDQFNNAEQGRMPGVPVMAPPGSGFEGRENPRGPTILPDPVKPGTTTPGTTPTTTPTSGTYQNTPEDRKRFLSQFADKPWFNADLFDSYLVSHPDWTSNTSYWSTRFTDAPGQGSNAGGAGTSLGRAFTTPPPAYTPYEPSYFSGSPNTTTYQAPAPFTGEFNPAAFDYAKFTAPDPNAVKADPAYQFRLKAGEDALQASASAKGTLRTGGTLKDIAAWASDFASSEYDKIYGRAMNEWQSGFDVAKGTYDENNQNALNRYNTGLNTYKTNADVGYNAWNANNTNAMNNFNAGLDVFKTNNSSAFNANSANNAGSMAQWAAQYGMSQDEINNLIKYAGIGANASAGAPPIVPDPNFGKTTPSGVNPAGVAQPNGTGVSAKDLYRPISSEDYYGKQNYA